jgi:hypothetical protein
MRDAKDIAILGGASFAGSAALIGTYLLGKKHHWPVAIGAIATVALNSAAVYQYSEDGDHWETALLKSFTNLYDLGLFLAAHKVLKVYGSNSQVGPAAIAAFGTWAAWRVADVAFFNDPVDTDMAPWFITDVPAANVYHRWVAPKLCRPTE